MATQTIEFGSVTGVTTTATLFSAGSDTVVQSVAATEATNRKGLFSAAFTDVAAGTYKLIGLNASSVPMCQWWVTLTLTTATFQAYEVTPSVIAAQVRTELTTELGRLDAAVTTRMASYTQPTGFLASTFPTTVASPTNITAGTITTVTNLTNAPTAGDLTPTMKASVTTAATASTPTAAAVTGSVGSVLGGINTSTGVITTLDALDTTQDSQHAITQSKVDVVDGVVDAILIDTVEIGVAGAGLTDLGGMSTGMKAQVNTEADTALTDYDAPTNTEMVAAFTEIKGATWDTTNTLEAIRDRGDAAWVTATGFSTLVATDIVSNGAITTLSGAVVNVDLVDTCTALTNGVNVDSINGSSLAAVRLALSAGSIIPGTVSTAILSPTTTTFAAGDITEATADHYNSRIIIFTSGALVGQATAISDYSLISGEGNFTVVAITEAPAHNDTFIII